MPRSAVCFLCNNRITDKEKDRKSNKMMSLNIKTLQANAMMASLLLICSQVLEIIVNFFPQAANIADVLFYSASVFNHF